VGGSQLSLSLDAGVRIHALSLIADSYYHLGNWDQAIQRRREGIELIGMTSRRTDPWAIEQMAGLEKLLREADDLKAEVESPVGPAGTGEDLAAFNNEFSSSYNRPKE
jgi:hypothetical protein